MLFFVAFLFLLFPVSTFCDIDNSFHKSETTDFELEFDTVSILHKGLFYDDGFQNTTNNVEWTDEMRLLYHLFSFEDSQVRPVTVHSDSISVVTRIFLLKILDLVEKDQILHLLVRIQLVSHFLFPRFVYQRETTLLILGLD